MARCAAQQAAMHMLIARTISVVSVYLYVWSTGVPAYQLSHQWQRTCPDPVSYTHLDIQLPDMTGLDISRELTKRYPREDLPPLVALTANVLKDKQEYLNAGMDDVLSKPLSVPALTAMIKKFWDTQDDEESTVCLLYTSRCV